MNCPECRELLQRHLDGLPPDGAGPDAHLAGCADCRGWFAAAGRLEKGLRHLPPVTVPADLAGRVAGRVLAERRARRRRLWVPAAAAALAASVALIVLLSRGRPTVEPQQPVANVPGPTET